MQLFPGKAPNQLVLADLQTLTVQEGRTVEYKRELPAGGDGREESRSRIAATICSFANTVGGTLLIGLEAKDGVPVAVAPLAGQKSDKVLQLLESIAKDKIQPSVRALIAAVETESGPIAVVEVPKTWGALHAVRSGSSYTVYARTSAGNMPLDFGEIRSRILGAETAVDAAKQFRDRRIHQIVTGNFGFNVDPGPAVVVHVCPLEGFTPGYSVPLDRAKMSSTSRVPLLAEGGANEGPTLNGYLRYRAMGAGPVASYSELYRNGCLEAVWANATHLAPGADHRYLSSRPLVGSLHDMIVGTFSLYRALEVNPPLALMVTLTGMDGIELDPGSHHLDRVMLRVRNDLVALPETLIEDLDVSPARILRPLMNVVWNAWGYQFCPHFDKDGNLAIKKSWE
ncbi:MAG TPA: ATP-binding protein [Terracidiphilus sp.]|jgi:hypothetical protein